MSTLLNKRKRSEDKVEKNEKKNKKQKIEETKDSTIVDNEEQEEENREYTIEKILARRLRKDRIEYNVKWIDFKYEENTWEPLQNLIEDYCFDKIFEYENMSIEKKIELLNEYKHLKCLYNVSEKTLRNIIDDLYMCQIPESGDIYFKCLWKTREGEKKPRLPRYYHYSIIKSIDKQNFHKAFEHFC